MNADSREASTARPCLIVAYGDPAVSWKISQAFRRRGWDVYPVGTGPEARRLARMLDPELVVLATDLEGETGWLTCEKVTIEVPHAKVFLVGDTSLPRNTHFASCVGAIALLSQQGSVTALVEEICGRSLPAAS